MRRITVFNLRTRLHRYRYSCLWCLLIALGPGGNAARAEAPASKPAASSCRVIRLETDRYAIARINARGQVAINVTREGRSRVVFYDGQGLRDFGTLGGTSATVAGLNDRGQIAFNVERNGASRAMFCDGRRLAELGTLGGPDSTAAGVNAPGQVAGTSSIAAGSTRAGRVVGATPFVAGARPHPFLWTPGQGLLDLGVGTAERGAGTEVNEHGIGAGNPTLRTEVNDVNNRGQAVGATGERAFVWTRSEGFVDLNTLATGGPAGLVGSNPAWFALPLFASRH